MKIIIVGGGPSTGKTAILFYALRYLKEEHINVGVVKIDCINSNDYEVYESLSIPYALGLSEDICPDHYLATNFINIFEWGISYSLDMVVIETAGLCNRCAPFLDNTLNICSIDYSSSIKAPLKYGPIVETADILMLSKGDLISQAERDVFKHRLQAMNNTADILEVNGISSRGSRKLKDILLSAKDLPSINSCILKYPMPSATCSYCVGEKRITEEYHNGIIGTIDFSRRY